MKSNDLITWGSMLCVLFFGCGQENSKNSSKLGFEIYIYPHIYSNRQSVRLGTYYKLNSADSIMVERLDYYQQGFAAFSNTVSIELDTVSFFSLYKQNNSSIYFKSDSSVSEIDSFRFLCGLDNYLNGTNPNAVSASHPLSSFNNMYWTDWTKYRYVVFEGKIKLGSGQISPFSFHTGLNYRKFCSIPVNKLVLKEKNELNLILNLEWIFNPKADGVPIDYKNGELQAHADPIDAELTQKFIINFSRAFTIE